LYTSRKPTDAEKKEFLECFGFEYINKRPDERWYHTPKGSAKRVVVYGGRWLYPDKSTLSSDMPQLDLTFLFKYPVAVLAEKGWMSRVQYSPLRDNDTGKEISGWTGYASVYYVKSGKDAFRKHDVSVINKDPADALFWALWEVRNRGGGKIDGKV
jgi:hypothetical protein